MVKITKFVLKRPVTTLLVVLSLIFFGAMSIFNTKLELTPELNMPMQVITTVYPGASPEDVNDLVTRKIEDGIGTMSGLDTITSSSNENYSMVLLQYEYGMDMDTAYLDLRKTLDQIVSGLPEDAKDPTIIQMDVNQIASMYLTVENPEINNLYNYAEEYIIPEMEKLSSVASVEVFGGNKDFIRVCLIPEKLSQYHLDINTVAQLVGAASFTMPAGTAGVGNQDLNVSLGVKYTTPEELENMPITAGNGNILYLKDIAVVSREQNESSSAGRYNGQDVLMLGLNRNTKYTSVDLSKEANKTMAELKEQNPNLNFSIINDSAEEIINSLKTVFETMLLAILISTVVLFVFYGDLKASLIVATSIPVSILTALVMMWGKGYSLNVVTLGSLVLGVGMMVDNSIVVLESCFRVKEKAPEADFRTYIRSAIGGSEQVAASVFGSTATTCVVFLPLGFLAGLSGQFFQPLGMTIVFCMIASLISALALVPLCFVYYKPQEKEKAPAYRMIREMQSAYRRFMENVIMKHMKLTALVTGLFFLLIIFMAGDLNAALMPDIDQGIVNVSINMRPGVSDEVQKDTYLKVEEIIAADENVENYVLRGSGNVTLQAYLKKKRSRSTKETAELWKEQLQSVDNCDLDVGMYSMMSMLGSGSDFTYSLQSADYQALKAASDRIYNGLQHDSRVTGVTSSMQNASPLIKVKIDPVSAAAEGLMPVQVSAGIYTMLSGTEAFKMENNGESLSVRIEFPSEEYDELSEVENILLTSQTGNKVFLKDIADIVFEDSPASISRTNKQYNCTISAKFTSLADKSTQKELIDTYVTPNMTNGVKTMENASDKMMREEFTNLINAVLIAIFLVFVVMAAQFESPRFSIMVMTTMPFAVLGSLSFLWLFDITISMVVMIGFLMLVGTVVNNGILYVDTVNQMRSDEGMEIKEALVEAGVIRLRPILMTTLTTVLAMIPMAVATGGSAELMQGLALVNIGGLITSTVMALMILPIYYYFMSGKKGRKSVKKNYVDD